MPRIPASTRPTSAASLFKHVAFIALFVVAAGCSGGGCTSCSSCGGITPLPNGFDATKRIENAGSARVTQSGFSFLQANLSTLVGGILGSGGTGGVINFPVPETMGSESIVSYDVCPGGANPNGNPPTCTAQINLGQAQLTIASATPNDIHITGTIPILLADLPINATSGCVDVPFVGETCVLNTTFDAALSGNGSCLGTAADAVPIDVDITISVETNANHTARLGYSVIAIPQVVDSSTLTSNLENSLQFCNGGVLSDLIDLGFIKDLVVPLLTSPLTSILSTELDNELCTKAATGAPCPSGSTADSSMICRYDNDPNNACVSMLLGTDGHINVGTLLESLSPGTQGPLDFVFAAGGPDLNTSDPTAATLPWGNLDPVAGGATLGLFGGAEANPISKCVPMAKLTLPTLIPIPDELFSNTITGWPATLSGPDVEIALSERFTNYALGSAYNSGVLCVGVSTASIPLLSSGAISLLAPSIKTLGLQEQPQQVAIVLRPSTPPTVTFGNGTNLTTDPLILVDLKQVAIDFYIFSLDRFIRFMTATFDLSVPVNLTVSSAGLTPAIDTIGVANGVVTNSQLLKEMPSDLASALASLLGGLVGQELSGSLPTINLNSSLASLGLNLVIPDTVTGMGSPGLRKLTKGTDNFLGIFGAFALPGMTPTGPTPPFAHTHVQVNKKTIDPAGLRFETLQPDNMPVVELLAASDLDDGTKPVEYQYKLDTGFWHPFTASRFITIRDPWMRVQGRHTVYVRSRTVGDPYSLDEDPAAVDVIIDGDPPVVKLEKLEDGRISIQAHDMITADPLVRWRADKGGWSDWMLASHVEPVVPGKAASLSVEASDNEGNVGTAQIDLVRGQFDGTASSCNCSTAGGSSRGGAPALLLLGVAIAGFFSRRRVTMGGPESPPKPPQASTGTPVTARTLAAPAAITAPRSGTGKVLGGAAMIAVASTWAGCSCGNNNQTMAAATTTSSTAASSSSGGTGGMPSSCIQLKPGLIGEYTSVAVNGSTIWVAGYSEGDWNAGYSYGDLVVGTWDGTKVGWKQVDGVPTSPAVNSAIYCTDGFRGGQTAPGDDVGTWTSIALDANNNPAVAYYDRTNTALKFAQYDGKNWDVQTVESTMGSDIGRYAKMLFLNGVFVIAYQSIAPGGTNGALVSKVRVATSASATPAEGSWAFQDVATSNTTPCRAQFCTAAQACVSTTGLCTTTLPASMCNPACSSSQACVGATPACADIWDTSKLDSYPDAIGDYITISPDGMGGFGLAYYDRTAGNLVMAVNSGGTWTTTIVDGESAPTPSGDCGIGANLFIDSTGNWNLAYVNGYSEAVQYVQVSKSGTVGNPEIIDDGLSVAGTANPDGQHLVGDDAHIFVDAGGVVHVSYADSTAGTLHYAVGQPGSTGHMWQVQAVTQSGFAGAFSNIVTVNNQLELVNWWRVGGGMVNGDVRIVTP